MQSSGSEWYNGGGLNGGQGEMYASDSTVDSWRQGKQLVTRELPDAGKAVEVLLN